MACLKNFDKQKYITFKESWNFSMIFLKIQLVQWFSKFSRLVVFLAMFLFFFATLALILEKVLLKKRSWSTCQCLGLINQPILWVHHLGDIGRVHQQSSVKGWSPDQKGIDYLTNIRGNPLASIEVHQLVNIGGWLTGQHWQLLN